MIEPAIRLANWHDRENVKIQEIVDVVMAMITIFLERRRRKSMLAAIEEESKVPTESQIEASETALN